MRCDRFLFAAISLALGLPLTSCRYDPVPQKQIDDLPTEEDTSELHRPGQPCVLCHSEYEGADPPLAIGGTIFSQNLETQLVAPVPGVFVNLYDARGDPQKACTNEAGNFWVKLEDWPDAVFPLRVRVGDQRMRSLIGRERDCAICHRAARVDRPRESGPGGRGHRLRRGGADRPDILPG